MALFLALAVLLLSGCGKAAPKPSPAAPQEDASGVSGELDRDGAETPAVGVVFGVGGMKDSAYNQLCWEGFERASRDFGIPMEYVETVTEADYDRNVQKLIGSGCRMVVCLGYSMSEIVQKAAEAHPDRLFAILDSAPRTDLPNLTCVMFAQEQGAYLAGAAAAEMTQSGTVGIILGNAGSSNERMNSFAYGYLAGVKDFRPDVHVLQYITNSFADLPGGKSAALEMVSKGADVIFQAAGGTGVGVIEGCSEAGIWAIGVDSDQRGLSPEHVIASDMKRVDNACYSLVRDLAEKGAPQSGLITHSLSDGGIDIAPVEENLRPGVLALNRVSLAIAAGEITVPSTAEEFEARYGDIYELG